MNYLKVIGICMLVLIMNSYISNAQISKKMKVAILIYDGVYLLDFAGPLEIFNDSMINDSTNAFDVFLVSPTNKTIKCHTNTEISANYSVDNCPEADILVIPGGNLNLASENTKIADWIKKVNLNTKITMSVCTGAFILAELGILDNMEATTWYGAAKRLQKMYPKIKIQPGKRFTDNGKIVTTAGVSAGVDGALHVVEKLYGKEIADRTAKYIEWIK